ncbi:MAG: hypothetical protein K8U57_07430 [Planctomycetes bacterium]|nr:hypothetical protein [Planctomycetota bacterium]
MIDETSTEIPTEAPMQSATEAPTESPTAEPTMPATETLPDGTEVEVQTSEHAGGQDNATHCLSHLDEELAEVWHELVADVESAPSKVLAWLASKL